VLVALLVLAGGGILVYNLTRPDPEPTSSPTPTETGPPVSSEGTFTATPDSYFDLDTGAEIPTGGVDAGEDVYFYQGGGSGELGVVGFGPPRLAAVDEPTYAACEAATAYDDINAQNIPLLPETQTYVCVRLTDQQRLSVMSIGPGSGAGFPVEYTTWQRE
jgi:hypothetical protein